ncbi:Alpha-L-iduronidase [Halotydeus destructor]|nr:Alpha-L-iduronidase [Halotydeus destructor]
MFCLIFWFLCSSVTENPVKDVDSTIKVTINGSNQVANLPHFWCSSGFCPPQPHQNIADYVLSNDMEQNLGLIGSLPSKCDSFQLRVHWLLNLIQVEPAIRRNSGLKSHPKLNFKNLDHFLRLLHKHGLKPGFEVMGNPSNYYSDLDDHRQLRSWSKLVHYTVSRYVKLFGFDYVQSWNFETWNEPDNGDFDGLNFTSESFLKYYEATRAGLDAVSKSLVLGGPGERCLPVRNDSLCWTLADKLVKSSSNYFLSFHEKGAEEESASIVSKESEIIEHLSRRYPGEELTVYNNEADPVRTWSKARPWQADTTYAAIMVRSVSEHVEHYFRRNGNHSVKFGLLSNDNAFLSYFPHQFDQRTLLARFQMNNSQANYTFFIKKPIYAATGLLGLLGNKLLQSESTDDLVRVIATETEEESFTVEGNATHRR